MKPLSGFDLVGRRRGGPLAGRNPFGAGRFRALRSSEFVPSTANSRDAFVGMGAANLFYAASTYPAAEFHPTLNKGTVYFESANATGRREIHVMDYDRATKAWGAPYFVTSDTLTLDNHGTPAGCRDPWGWRRVFCGAHASQMKWFKSAAVDNIKSAWTTGASLAAKGDFSYPHPIIVGDTGAAYCLLFMRGIAGSPSTDCSYLSLLIFTLAADGTETIGNRIDLVNFNDGGVARFYAGNPVLNPNDGKIYIPASWSNAGDTIRRDLYCFVVDPTNPAALVVTNLAGTRTDLQAAFPINLANSKTHYRIVNQESQVEEGTTPNIVIDANNDKHFFYTEGAENGSVYDYKHIWFDTSANAIQPAVVIHACPAGAGMNHSGIFGYAKADGSLVAQFDTQQAVVFARGGDQSRATWTAAGGWSAATLVHKSDGIRPLGACTSPRNAPEDWAFVWQENQTQDVTTYVDGQIRGYASAADIGSPLLGTQWGAEVSAVANRIFDSVGSMPSDAYLTAAAIMIEKLRVANLWRRPYTFYVLLTHVSGAALINWQSSRFNATVVGSPVFVAYSGYRAVSGGYWNLQHAANTLTDTSFSTLLAVNGLGVTNAGSALLGTITAGNTINEGNNEQTASGAFNRSASAGTCLWTPSARGNALIIGDRTGTTQKAWVDAVAKTPTTATTSASNSENFLLGRRGATSSLANFLVAATGVGGWTDAEAAIADEAVRTFINTVAPGAMT